MEIIRILVESFILPLAVAILTELFIDWKDGNKKKKE